MLQTGSSPLGVLQLLRELLFNPFTILAMHPHLHLPMQQDSGQFKTCRGPQHCGSVNMDELLYSYETNDNVRTSFLSTKYITRCLAGR